MKHVHIYKKCLIKNVFIRNYNNGLPSFVFNFVKFASIFFSWDDVRNCNFSLYKKTHCYERVVKENLCLLYLQLTSGNPQGASRETRTAWIYSPQPNDLKSGSLYRGNVSLNTPRLLIRGDFMNGET